MTPSAVSDNSPVDDSLPTTDQPDSDTATESSEGFTIPSSLAETAGLGDLQPGDNFTVTITGTVTGNDPDSGITASLTDATNGSKADAMDDSEPDEPGFVKPKSKIELGPKDMESWKK